MSIEQSWRNFSKEEEGKMSKILPTFKKPENNTFHIWLVVTIGGLGLIIAGFISFEFLSDYFLWVILGVLMVIIGTQQLLKCFTGSNNPVITVKDTFIGFANTALMGLGYIADGFFGIGIVTIILLIIQIVLQRQKEKEK